VRKKRSNKLKMAAWGLALVVFAVGIITVVEKAGSILPGQARKSPGPTIKVVQEIKKAPFNFLVPGTSDAWSYDGKSLTFDPERGVTKYNVKLKYANADVAISQQVMPDQLKPQKSPKFMEFIQTSNVVRSQQAGAGTIYYVAFVQNGAQANGADAVIYATNDILMFGRTGSALGYDAWANLMTSMIKQDSK
jgi:hypothetical protein